MQYGLLMVNTHRPTILEAITNNKPLPTQGDGEVYGLPIHNA